MVSLDEEIGERGRDGSNDKIRGRRPGLKLPAIKLEYVPGNIPSELLAQSGLVEESISLDCKSAGIDSSCIKLLEIEPIDSLIGDKRGFEEGWSILQIVPLAFI